MTELATPRADLVKRVKLYFPVGSRAAEWYKDTLTDVQRNGSWEDFETLFNAKFPSQEKEQKGKKMYRDELTNLTITNEQLLTTHESTNQPYHKWYADKVLVLATGAGIRNTDSLINTVWQKLPYALKKVVDEDTEDWEKFAKAIKDVSWGKLKVEAEHELESRRPVPAVIPETPRTKLAGVLAATRLERPTSPTPNRYRNSPSGGRNYSGAPPRRNWAQLTNEQKDTLRMGIESKTQHPSTATGIAAWRDEARNWAVRNGPDPQLSELTVMPLKPGTRPVCTGECFKCGQQSHGRSATCPNPNDIPALEGSWRAYCQSQLGSYRRAAMVNVVGAVGTNETDDGDWFFRGMRESGNGEGSN